MTSTLMQVSLLASFVLFRSALSLLTRAARGDSASGFPFLFQTMLFFPFVAQSVFYFVQLAGVTGGMSSAWKSILINKHHIKSAAIYSSIVAAGNIMQTQSMAYLDAGTFVVLQQVTILFIAVFEAIFFAQYPTVPLAGITLLQGFGVGMFNYMGQVDTGGKEADASDNFMLGVGICLVSVVFSAFGSILQQKFMQKQAMEMPLAAKLCVQHVIGFGVMLAMLLSNADARGRLVANGFFDGWNRWTVACTLGTWVYYWCASAVTAHVSAMAAAMCGAVAIVFTGLGEFFFFDKRITSAQQLLMVAICGNAMMYTQFKAKALAAKKALEEKSEKQKQ